MTFTVEGYEPTKFNIMGTMVGIKTPNYQLEYIFGTSDLHEVDVSNITISLDGVTLTINNLVGKAPIFIKICPSFWDEFVKSIFKDKGLFREESGEKALTIFIQWWKFFLPKRASYLKEQLVARKTSVQMICIAGEQHLLNIEPLRSFVASRDSWGLNHWSNPKNKDEYELYRYALRTMIAHNITGAEAIKMIKGKKPSGGNLLRKYNPDHRDCRYKQFNDIEKLYPIKELNFIIASISKLDKALEEEFADIIPIFSTKLIECDQIIFY